MFDKLPQTIDELHLSCGNCGCFYHTGSCYGLYLIGNMVKACDCTKPKPARIVFKFELDEESYESSTISRKSASTNTVSEYKPFKLPWQ